MNNKQKEKIELFYSGSPELWYGTEPLLKLDFSEDICNTSLQLSMSNDEISKYLEVAPLQVSHQLPREIPGLENFYWPKFLEQYLFRI